ncbi:MAG TPA: HAMP domain-containing sensor histidine kinase [Terriglobales bacterium]|nr:HAMP domain-containing sensor histidine kinase [Terriglobales bacterium]
MPTAASRTKKIAFFITLGACLVGLAVILNVTWIIHWKSVAAVVVGIIFFSFIIAGVALNTIFLVREIRRNEQQDSFLNAVTHELKTPIASIRLYLETLERRDIAEPKRHEFYRIMLDDTDRLLGTVEQVLKAGELRDGARKNWQQVDFSSVIRECLDLARVRHKLRPDELRFTTDASGELFVLGVPDELRIAVTNLLDNAIKYSGAKKDIEVTLNTPDIDNVVLSVRDAGIGIPRSELKRVFKRFYRVHAAAAGQIKGTGLGLFIVRSVARHHGGDAYADSEGEGRGSTFTIRLPRVYPV